MPPVSKIPVKKWTGEIIGWLETDAAGNQLVRDFSGKVLGKYDKVCDVTRNFEGAKVTKGNTVVGFLYKNLKY